MMLVHLQEPFSPNHTVPAVVCFGCECWLETEPCFQHGWCEFIPSSQTAVTPLSGPAPGLGPASLFLCFCILAIFLSPVT